MTTQPTSKLPVLLQRHENELLRQWLDLQMRASTYRPDLLGEDDLRRESAEFLSLLRQAVQSGQLADVHGPAWQPVRDSLSGLSRTWATKGFSPTETATFVFSLKEPLFVRLKQEYASDPLGLAADTWLTSALLDRLGLYTTEVAQRTRDEVIARQQQELMELSTPVVTLWSGVLALPLIGTLDSARTQVVMENLLQRIVQTGASIAILDITGVPTVDTLVAQHLLKTVAAARLMGADCIISGIRPQIAQTIVHLGVDLGSVATKATLADAFRVALERTGQRLVGSKGAAPANG